MKRTNQTQRIAVDAIFVADIHLREDLPVCRTDDFYEAQFFKLSQISRLQEEYNCPVLHSGDLFHHWKPSPSLLTRTIESLPDQFYSVFGNHDLPQHNMELAYKSGVMTLVAAGKLKLLPGGNWGEKQPKEVSMVIKGRKILVWHILTWLREKPYPDCMASDAIRLLRKNPDFDVILTGDNHQTFHTRLDDRVLVNPGSMTRQTASQVDHQPVVYFYEAERNIVQPHYLQIKEGVVSRQHLEKVEQREKRITAFVTKLKGDYLLDLSFRDNLQRFLQQDDQKQLNSQVINIIHKSLEED